MDRLCKSNIYMVPARCKPIALPSVCQAIVLYLESYQIILELSDKIFWQARLVTAQIRQPQIPGGSHGSQVAAQAFALL